MMWQMEVTRGTGDLDAFPGSRVVGSLSGEKDMGTAAVGADDASGAEAGKGTFGLWIPGRRRSKLNDGRFENHN